MKGKQVYLTGKEISIIFAALDILQLDSTEETYEEELPAIEKIESKLLRDN